MLEVSRKHKVVTQMGTQGHPAYVRTVELIQSGVIGAVREVHVVTDRPIWPQGMTKRPAPAPVPATLRWDLWLGPAADREYSPAYLPFVWRGWWDFGTGALGDMACHLMDAAFWALKLQYPTSVDAVSDGILPDSAPTRSVITYEFPKRGDLPPVKMVWYDGGKKPSSEMLEGQKLENGSLFIGDKGKLIVEHMGAPRLLPESKFADFSMPRPTLPRVESHYTQWVDACRTGGVTGSNFEYACPLTESVLLGNVALRAGKKIEWDAKHLKAKNLPEADQFIQHHWRSGYSL
jgi:predicted dehydrogenase